MKKIALILIMCSLIFTTGCVSGYIRLSINTDTSSDVKMKILVNKTIQSLIPESKNPIYNLKNDLIDAQFKVSDINEYEKSGILVEKRFEDLEELNLTLEKIKYQINGSKAETVANIQKDEMFTVDKGLFSDIYYVDLRVDLGKLTPDDGITKFLSKAVMNSVDFKFILDTPIKPLMSNATNVYNNGKTMEWTIVPLEENIFQLQIKVPNVGAIAIASILAVTLIGIGIWFILRKRKLNK